ncbi:hypothetical protein INT45_007836 [Circinella minor]|uniref:SWIM-type domain-containing protein n=1 Tax=Circinella minor TaxID=1195481 RepID=A0A8H7RYT1_9FUNG|nr:hypothetical protein INT45_007836 [Circinella minor]
MTCRNKNSHVGKAIPVELLITLNEAIELIPSHYENELCQFIRHHHLYHYHDPYLPSTPVLETTTNLITNNTADARSTPPAINPANEQLSTRSDLIVQFFTKLRERGLRLMRFMFTDKDERQINAITNIFGEDAVQRWFQPTENREGRRCDYADHCEIIVSMMQRHYDIHMNRPVGGVIVLERPTIFMAVYRSHGWRRWARNSRITIPIGKTTMMIESQWRILKRDFLVNSIRPDVWIIWWSGLYHSEADSYYPSHVFIKNHWELDQFVREWHAKTGRGEPGFNSRRNRSENMNAEKLYSLSIENWTCGCPSYAKSRFMLCKHLIPCLS